MTDFRLASIDWDSVRLLHGEHLSHETAYIEDLVRWVLHCGPPAGVVHMDRDSLSVVQSSAETYRVTLRRCQAVTPQRYWVHIGDEKTNPTCDLDKAQHLEQVVNIYLGVDMREKESRDHAPAQSSALIGCKSRWPKYVLDIDETSRNRDWLQIGQVINRAGELVLDPGFIPACYHLGSHPRLIEAVKEIRELGERGLATLGNYGPSSAPQDVRGMAAAFATSLAPAATVADWQARSHAYVEQMATVLTANRTLASLCSPDTGYRDDAIMAIDKALHYTRREPGDDLLLGPALAHIKEALEVIIQLYGHLVTAAPAAPPPPMPLADHEERIFRRIT